MAWSAVVGEAGSVGGWDIWVGLMLGWQDDASGRETNASLKQ